MFSLQKALQEDSKSMQSSLVLISEDWPNVRKNTENTCTVLQETGNGPPAVYKSTAASAPSAQTFS